MLSAKFAPVFFFFCFYAANTLFSQVPKLVLPIGHTDKIASAEFSPDGKKVVTASDDKTAKVWDVATGYLLADLKGHKGAVTAAQFSPDGKKILTKATVADNDYYYHDWYKLWDAANGTPLSYLKIFDSSFSSFPTFSGDGEKILTITDSVRIWNINNGLAIKTLIANVGAISLSLFSADSRYIFVADTNKTIGVWDVATGKQQQLLKGYTAPVKVIRQSSGKNEIITVSANETIIWDANSWSVIRKIPGFIDGDEIFQLTPDGQKIVTANYYNETNYAKLWSAVTRKLFKKYLGYSLITDPDNFLQQGGALSGTIVAASDNRMAAVLNVAWYNNLQMGMRNDKKVRIWDTKTGLLKGSLEGHTAAINFIQFSRDGKTIVTASDDRTVKIWDAANGKLLTDLKGHAFNSRVVLFRPVATDNPVGEKQIVTSSDDGSVKLWDVAGGNLLSSFKAHDGDIFSLQFSRDGKKLISASRYGTVNIWDIEKNKKITLIKDPSFSIDPTADEPENDRISGLIAPELSPDGAKAVSAIHSSTANVFNANNGKLLYKLEANNRRFQFIHFSPDGKKIIGGWVPEFPSSKGRDSTIQVWDAENGKPLFKISPYHIWMSDANFTPDGKRILIISMANSNKQVLLCDAENGKPTNEWQDLSPWSGNVNFSNDGTKTVICGDSIASIIEMKTGKHLADIKTGEDLVSAQFSHDAKKIAVILKSGNPQIWYIEKGTKVFDLTGHTDEINLVQFNPDNKTLITTSKDNTAKVWDADSGKCLYTFFSIDSSDYFNLLPSGYYKGTGNASKLLHYVTNGLTAISFEQLDVKYNRPDKVLKAMNNADTSLTKSYRLAYEKRIKKLGIDTTSFLDGYSVPEADFVNRETVQSESKKEGLNLTVKATNSVYDLGQFNIWINEVPLFGMRGINIKNRNTNNFDTTVNVSLSYGENRIETSVTDINGTESYRKPLIIKYDPPTKPPSKVYFIGIGINNFADSSRNLRWCVQDIKDLAKAMQVKYKSQFVIIDTLFNQKVTLENIKALKQKLFATGINDKVIISYSGHGLLSKDFDYYLSSYNVNFDNPEIADIPYGEIENLVDSIPARQKILFLDACNSGEVDKEDLLKANKSGGNLLAKNTVAIPGRKGGDVDADGATGKIGLQNSFELMQSLFVNVGKGTGAIIISASGGVQFAQEQGKLGHGVFTYSLLEAIKKYPSIKISALKKYIGERVMELTDGLQKPTTRNETIAVDWNVW